MNFRTVDCDAAFRPEEPRCLPYKLTKDVCLYLNDFDIVEDSNLETGVIFEKGHEDELKTRVLNDWLKALGFRTRLLERKFDDAFRLQQGEPQLAFCGFDTNPARPATKIPRIIPPLLPWRCRAPRSTCASAGSVRGHIRSRRSGDRSRE
jgi:hypothetical protein